MVSRVWVELFILQSLWTKTVLVQKNFLLRKTERQLKLVTNYS